MSGLVRNEQQLATEPTLATALAILDDPAASIPDKAGAYGVGHQVQLRINRKLKKVRDDIITYMVAQDVPALGPLSVKSTPIDVDWPCNAEGNWQDDTIQGALREVYSKVSPEFVRHVPEHYEINTAALGAAVHLGDPVALQLHREMKDKGWRTEAGRRLSLAVKEVK